MSSEPTAFLPNSPYARDIQNLVHSQTNLRSHQSQGPQIIKEANGVEVIDENGARFLDSTAGLWCASLGFNVERLARVAYEQMKTLGYYHTYRHSSNHASIDLAERLIDIAPVPMSKVLFQCSGSEANDLAIKLCWYFQNAAGKPEKIKIIGRKMGYHGSTIGAASLSGKPDMYADFNLPLPMFRHTEFPHYYRFHEDGESEEAFAARMADKLEELILEEGPETVAAFFAEPAMGAAGAVPPPATYFEKIQEVLKRHDVLFVADEVICGFGRTGNMWGTQTYGLRPDIVTCAKALSAAHQPISALMVSEHIFEAMLDESDKQGHFAHGSTYAGHPVATAVALETLKIYEEIDVAERSRVLGRHLHQRLNALRDHPLVGDIRGDGLFAGVELVEDKVSRRLFDPSRQIGARVGKHAKEQGLILRVVGDRLAFAPALVIEPGQLDRMVDSVEYGLEQTWRELQSA
jgi:4-aminobutyrate--pyruvate transaminase